jgi:phenylacetate-CoA ligase
MNKHFLKTLRDKIPEPLKYIAGPIFRNKLIKNKEFSKYYTLLENRELIHPDKIIENQFSQLKQVLIHSYQNVPYYHELFNKVSFAPHKFSDLEQIKKIPFLTRQIIKDNFDQLISGAKVRKGHYIATTGGSSGLPLKFLLDYDSIFKENAFIYYFRKKLNYQFEDKLVTFRSTEYGNKLWKFNPMYNEMIFYPRKLSKINIAGIAKKINEFNPQFLNGYLSAIWYFAKLVDEYKINISLKLKGIFLISENLDPGQRTFIEQFFNVKSSTFYGHSERCVIAEEITPYNYKFDPYYGFTEFIQLEDDQFSIVGTGFLNYTMPLIRYKTDDIITPVNQYYSISGKKSSTSRLVGANDEFLTITALGLTNPIFKNILNFQFIQNEKGKADLLIIVSENFQMSEMEGIKNQLRKQNKGIIDMEIKIVENLVLSPRGKYDRYISRLINGS